MLPQQPCPFRFSPAYWGIGPVKLTLDNVRSQLSGKNLVERIRRDFLRDRNRLSCCFLRCRFANEMVRYLVDIGVELRQVHAVRSGISNVSEESPGQFALDAEVPLLHVSVLLHRDSLWPRSCSGLPRTATRWVAGCARRLESRSDQGRTARWSDVTSQVIGAG